jgi:hypothetical protein
VESAKLTPLAAASPATLRVRDSVTLHLETGYKRRVRGGSLWRPVGNVPQGLVLRPVGAEFTIEGQQVHEAFLVVRDQSIVGFFLPGEAHFSALTPSQSIKLDNIND